MGKASILGIYGLGVALLLASGAPSFAQDKDELTIALIHEPPTMDLQVTNDNISRSIGVEINEGLFAPDADFKPHPVLATGSQLSADGLTYTFPLRQGVLFHNGDEMTSDDVVASLNRWLKRSPYGKTLGTSVDSITAVDKYTVAMKMKTPTKFVLEALSTWQSGAFIYPAKVIADAGDGDIKDFIGTGPFKFVSYHQGQDILLEKFDGYKPVDEPATGYAGARKALVDKLHFVFVPEDSTRRIGVDTGEYDMALDVSAESRDLSINDPNVVLLRGAPRMTTINMNKAQGPMSNVLMRQALQSLVCVNDIMPIYGAAEFWRADPSILWKETAWWSDVGKDSYNICNPDKAKALVAQAGYKGDTIHIVARTTEKAVLGVAQIIQQELQSIGVNADLKLFDAASFQENLYKKDGWDVSFNESLYRTDPMQISTLQSTWAGWWENDQRDQLVHQYLTGPAGTEKAVWDQIQGLYYTEVPLIKIGDFFTYHLASKKVVGYPNLPEPIFWNVSVSK